MSLMTPERETRARPEETALRLGALLRITALLQAKFREKPRRALACRIASCFRAMAFHHEARRDPPLASLCLEEAKHWGWLAGQKVRRRNRQGGRSP
jgi:hypothetical protein